MRDQSPETPPDSALYLAGLNFLRINDAESPGKLTQVMENWSSRYLEAAKLATPIPFCGARLLRPGSYIKICLKLTRNYPAPYCYD